MPNKPTFKILTGAMRPYTKDIDGVTRRFLSCTASSSVTDLHGDEIASKAIESMAAQAISKEMTIFLNHSYEIPEDVFGTTVSASVRKSGELDKYNQPIWDLDLDIRLNEANPRAVQTYAAYDEQGVKMGVSIGALIEEWEPVDKKAGAMGGLRINEINLLEASIVGIPANQRSWVKRGLEAIKSFEKEAAAEPILLEGTVEQTFIPVTKLQTELHDDPKDTPEPDADPAPADGDEDGDPVDATKSVASPPDASPEPETDPDQVEDGDPEAPTDGAAQTVVAQAAPAGDDQMSKAIVLLLDGYKAELATTKEALRQAEKQRDEAQEAMKLAQAIVEKIASLPLGRKTAFAQEVNTFRRDLSGIYGEDFLNLLGRNDE